MALLKTKNAILHEIQRLHTRRVPLNITAVKRSHPKLIAQTYAVRPFWGWKQALEAAGVDYGKINVELLDYVNCQLCGCDVAILTSHLAATHGVSTEEYRAEFPEAELMCETIRAARSRLRGGRSIIPHWEPIHSREYVLDRVAELHRRGYPANSIWMQRHERALFNFAWKAFASWDEVLRRVGLAPETVRLAKPGRSWTEEQVIAALLERQNRGLPLNHSTLVKEQVSLTNAIKRHFGSYAQVLRKAGIRPEAVRRKLPVYSEAQIQRMLRAVRRAAELPDAERAKEWTQLHRRYNCLAIASRFGNWTKVFAEAGVSRSKFLGRRFPDRESVLGALRSRLEQGEPVNAKAIFHADRTLFREVLRYFDNSFAAVFPALGLPTPRNALRGQRRYSSKRAVVTEIRRRSEAGEPLTTTSLRRGPFSNSPLQRAANE